MKKVYTSVAFIFIVMMGFGQWKVYTGSALPETAGWGVAENLPGPQNNESIVMVDTFQVLNFYSPNTYDPTGTKDNARKTFNMKFDSATVEATIIVRTKGYSQEDYLFDSVSTILELGFRPNTSGNRDLMTVNYVDGEGGYTTEVDLKRVDSTYSIGDDMWHTFRITMNSESGEYTVYLDENPTPVISGFSTKSGHDDNEIRLGDEGSATVGGYIDWIAMNSSGRYAPGEGEALPEYIFVDGRDNLVSVTEERTDIFRVYPNPARDYLNISTIQRGSEVSLYDITGKRMMYKIINTTKETLNTRDLPSGLYFVKVRNVKGVQTEKLILE
ncbi:MAG: T9SS type A sorting domain-containing protein [Bacteroidales bacterium]|nr:T9SS type A sorting domain-containing protein [Bacteroidales bacterium]MCF8389593.1 T9SS type A sorting domain-containing protein [Bacteroidales bacterium]